MTALALRHSPSPVLDRETMLIVEGIEEALIDGHISAAAARNELMRLGFGEFEAFAMVHRIMERIGA